MRKYKIADLVVGIESNYERNYRQAEKYRVSDEIEPDFCLKATEKEIDRLQTLGQISRDDADYCQNRLHFQQAILNYDGLVLHSSAVVYEGRAYLFSANSGVGKSTHTRLWLQAFGKDAFILNDDAPAIRFLNGRWLAYGTPWSGSSALNANACAPLQGIAFLERSETNWIRRITPDQAFPLFMLQESLPYQRESATMLLDRALALVSSTPIYQLGCNLNADAALVAYASMRENERADA